MNTKVKGNVAMLVSKTFSGFNENALRYLLPHYMNAATGVFLRVAFATAFFWGIGACRQHRATHITRHQKLSLLALGFVCIFCYMFFLLKGLSYTTPVSSSIFISLQPVVVFIICLLTGREKATSLKVIGIIIGVTGAAICVLTQKSSDVASDPALGNLFCAGSTIVYSLYLIFSKQLLRNIDSITVSKWTFLGATLSALPIALITGWHAPVLKMSIISAPMLVLLFVLIFPSSVSYLLVDIGLKNLAATVVALYGAVILIVATIASYIFGQDHFSWWQILSVCLIILSMYLVETEERKTQPTPQGKK